MPELNHIHHIKIPKSTHSIPNEIEKPVMSTKIFIVLLITQIISSLLVSSPIFALSKYRNNFDWINFEATKVKTITTTTSAIFIARFSKNSHDKNQSMTWEEDWGESVSQEDTAAHNPCGISERSTKI